MTRPRYAAQVAELFATNHRSRIVAADDFGLIDTLADAFDEPFADACALATYRVSELAREKVKVALSGDGADEAFAGYRRYRLFAAEERVRAACCPGPLGARRRARSATSIPSSTGRRKSCAPRRRCRRWGRGAARPMPTAVGVTPPAIRRQILTAPLHGHVAEERYVRAMAEAPAHGRALPRPICRSQDLAARRHPHQGRPHLMAVSLEAREPLLDHRLVEFAARLPAKHAAARRRRQMADEARARLAACRDEILHRRKMGFVTPVSAWFRGPLAGEAAAIAHGSALAETGWFDAAAIARLADAHRSGRSDHGRLLWQLLMLEKSLQRLFGLGGGASARPDRAPRRNRARRAAR